MPTLREGTPVPIEWEAGWDIRAREKSLPASGFLLWTIEAVG